MNRCRMWRRRVFGRPIIKGAKGLLIAEVGVLILGADFERKGAKAAKGEGLFWLVRRMALAEAWAA